MTPLHLAWLLITALSFLCAVALARTTKEHKPVAWYLGAVIALDLLRLGLARALPAAPTMPLEGLQLALRHASQAAYLAIILAPAALSLRLFTRRPVWLVGVAYACTLTLVVGSYPTIRGEDLMRLYSLYELASGVSAIGIYFCCCPPKLTTTSVCGLAIICGRLASVLVPPLTGLGTLENWTTVVALNATISGLVLVVHVWRLAVRKPQDDEKRGGSDQSHCY